MMSSFLEELTMYTGLCLYILVVFCVSAYKRRLYTCSRKIIQYYVCGTSRAQKATLVRSKSF
jgi:hypothetical protein